MRLYKKIIFIVLCVGMYGVPALQAQDEYAYISVNSGLSTALQPTIENSAHYLLKGGLFLGDQWSIAFLWDLAFQKNQSSRTGLGLEYILMPYELLTPYVGADFMYQYEPGYQFGVRLSFGVEWDLFAFTGMNNIRLRVEAAYTELFKKNQFVANSRIDPITLGLAWHF